MGAMLGPMIRRSVAQLDAVPDDAIVAWCAGLAARLSWVATGEVPQPTGCEPAPGVAPAVAAGA